MKRIFLQLILLVAVASTAWGQMTAHLGATDENGNLRYENGNYFALWSDTEVRIDWQAEAKPYVLNGPGEILSFKGRSRPGGIDSPSIAVREGTLQENSETVEYSDSYIFHQRVVDSYTSYGDYKDIPLTSGHVTHLRFENKKGTLDRWINNIRVTMGKYLFFDFDNETLTHTLTFPTKILNTGAESLSFTFDWANIDDLVITNNTQAFTINTLTEYSQKGAWGTTKLTVTCDYTQAGNFEEYITIYSPTLGQSIVLNLKADVQDVQLQTISWEQMFTGLPIGTTIQLNATTNSGLPVTYASADASIAKIEGNTLIVVGEGTTTITASHAGNDEWFAVSMTKTVSGYNPSATCGENYKTEAGVTLKKGLTSLGTTTKELTWDSNLKLIKFECNARNTASKYAVGSTNATLYVDIYKNSSASVSVTENSGAIAKNSSKDYSLTFTVADNVTKLLLRNTGKDIELTNIKLTFAPNIATSTTTVDCGVIGWKETTQTADITINYSALPSIHKVKLLAEHKVFSLIDAYGNPTTEIAFSETCSGLQNAFTFKVQFSSMQLNATDFDKTDYETTLVFYDKDGHAVTYATPITVKGKIIQDLPSWLPIIPTATSTSVVPAEKEYVNMLYWEMDDALRTAVGASGNYATLQSTADITILGSQYMLFSAEADNWRSFVAPMDVEKAYVIELLSEAELETMSVQEALQAQTAAYADFYNEVMKQIVTNNTHDNLMKIINAYINGKAGAGIYDLEHYNGTNAWTYTYYLYESAPTWVLNGDGFAKEWTPVAAAGDIMQRGETYAINFPYCLDCPDYTGWDYWTGKLILLEHKGEQTIQGQHAADAYMAPMPTTGVAVHAGNACFAEVQSGSNAFMHNAATDTYEATADTRLRPTASVLYASVPTKQGKRAVAITRQGDIIWEDDAADDSGVITDIDAVAQSTLRVMAQDGGFSVLSDMVQEVYICSVDGRLVYQGTIGAGEAQFFSVNAGMYVVRTSAETMKVLAR